jgi:predicted  nucleic acid-binding Zn-ribbon protein
VAAEENKPRRKKQRRTIGAGSSVLSTTAVPKTNSSKPEQSEIKEVAVNKERKTDTSVSEEQAKRSKSDKSRKIVKASDETQVGNQDQGNQLILDPLKIQKSLRSQFVVTLAAGSALIFFNPAVNYLNWPAVSQIYISVALMGLFWLFALKNLKTALARSVFADSMYYLGFLFTFVALVAAMMSLASLEGKEFEIESIIGQMGPALITTVVGMAVRIYLTQFDAITDEPEQEKLVALGKLTSNLIPALDKLEEVIRTNQKVMEEHQRNSQEEIKKFVASLDLLNFQNVRNEIDGLGEAVKRVSQETDNLSFNTKTATSKLQSTSDELNKVTNEATRITDNLSKAEDFSEKVDSLNKVVEKADENINSSVDKMEKNIQVAARQINLSTANISKDMKNIEDEAKTLSARIKTAISDVVGFLSGKK